MAAELPRIGAQVLGSVPTGSMRSDYASRVGYGLGVFADWEMGVGKSLRVGYDGIWYPTKSRTVEVGNVAEVSVPASSDDKCRSHAVTAQMLFYPAETNEGFYYKVGLGGMNYLTRTSTGGGPTVLSETGTKLACLGGVGYDFGAHWGVMAQYSFITVENRTLGAVQTGVSYRF
jgi:hypothetical protein